MSLSYREDYWDDAAAKAEFIRFLKELFNLDLTRWDEGGFWDENYRPFSFFEGSALAANVCVYSMNMCVAGQDCKVAQISAVGTRPDYRRQGLAQKLTARAVEWARERHDFFYLFADLEAYPFYAKSGFKLCDERKARIVVKGRKPMSSVDKLDVNNAEHLQKINRMVAERTPVSEQLGVYNRRLFMFWCLYFLRDQIHYIPELDLLVLFERKDDLVVVSDIVAKGMPPFSDVYPHIAAENDRFVEFLFMPDRMKIEPIEWIKVAENGLHLEGDFPLDGGKFLFPLTSHA